MNRNFIPVGQGAFYLERFEDGKEKINVIYDCGSEKNEDRVNEMIDRYFEEGEKIDALVISHLHEDHINGIPHLLKHCKVEKIYFPLITSANKVLMSIDCEIRKRNQFVTEFINNPEAAIGNLQSENKPELISIGDNINGISNNNGNISIISSGADLMKDIIESRSLSDDAKATLKKWKYIPFNFRQKDRIQKLQDALNSRGIDINDVEETWKCGTDSEKATIIEAYKEIPGGLNTNSLTLFSGTEMTNIFQYLDSGKTCIKTCSDKWSECGFAKQKAGCLFTGDYDAAGKNKWTELYKAYEKYWNYIGCVQVPHHGSIYNFNEKLLELKCIYIISAGTVNRYKHPNGAVLKHFIMKRMLPFIVTEKEDSEVLISVTI